MAEFSRRDLLSGAAVLGLAVSACSSRKSSNEAPRQDDAMGRMTYRVNPKNGDKISLLGYGCMRFPTMGNDKSAIDEEMAEMIVDEAVRRGINYFDTAWPYHGGNSETFIGKVLKKYPRDSFYLSSKFPGNHVSSYDEGVEIFEKQLQKCQVAYFDYYQLHALQRLEDYRKVYEEAGLLQYLLDQRKAGRIRNLGWSFHGDRELWDYMLGLNVDWDFVLIQLNYMDWERGPDNSKREWVKVNGEPPTAKQMYEELTERGIPVIVMEPLLGGTLARLNREASAILKSEKPEDSVAKWAFRFVGSQPNVLTVLSGMTYMEHLVENARTFSPLEPLSERELEVLWKAAEAQRARALIQCTACRYCMPCPYGIDIPTIFTHYNKCVTENMIPEDEKDPDYAKARRAFLVSYDRAVSDLRQADKCVACGRCVRRCPQMIDIPGELLKIARIVESLR